MIQAYYHLGKFPPPHMDWERLMPIIGKAQGALGHYKGVLSVIPNAALLLSPLITQEAVLSSRIEGTQVTMSEVFEIEAGGDASQAKKEDAEEVINYRIALQNLTQSLEERPFSEHSLREAHATLLQGVRGKDKTPGSYRTEQNWIGTKNCSFTQASFVPVAPEHLHSSMQHWIQFWREDQYPDPLVQLALLHVEFEAIHPFKDGNGRLGRMIIPLFLHHKKLLDGPFFYMSSYFEEHREVYYDKLRAVSSEEAWTEWCIFFLQGIIEQAQQNSHKANTILSLYKRTKEQVATETRSQHIVRIVDFLFQNPQFSSSQFAQTLKIGRPTAWHILSELRESNILQVAREGRGRRAGKFAFQELIHILEK